MRFNTYKKIFVPIAVVMCCVASTAWGGNQFVSSSGIFQLRTYASENGTCGANISVDVTTQGNVQCKPKFVSFGCDGLSSAISSKAGNINWQSAQLAYAMGRQIDLRVTDTDPYVNPSDQEDVCVVTEVYVKGASFP